MGGCAACSGKDMTKAQYVNVNIPYICFYIYTMCSSLPLVALEISQKVASHSVVKIKQVITSIIIRNGRVFIHGLPIYTGETRRQW